MAVELATAYVSIVPSTKGIKSKLTKEFSGPASSAAATAGASAGKGFMSRFSSGVSGAVGKVASTVGNAITTTVKRTAQVGAGILTAALAAAGVGGFKRLMALEEADKRLRSMGISVKDTEKLMEALNGTLKGTPYALDAGATAMAGFVSAGVDLKKVPSILKSVTDAAAFGQADLGEVADIFQKVQLNGKATTEMLNQLQYRGIPATAMLADALGMTGEEFQAFVSDGKLGSEQFFSAWEKGAKGFGDQNIKMEGAAKNAGDTVRGAWGNMMTALSRIGATVLAPVFNRLGDLFGSLTGWIDGLKAKVGPMVESFAASGRIEAVWARVVEVFRSVADRVMAVDWAGIFGQVRSVVESAAGALASVDWAGIIGAIADKVSPLVPKVVDLASTLGEALVPAAQTLGDALGKLLPWLADVAAAIAGPLLDGATALAPALPVIADLVSGLVDLVTKVPPSVLVALGAALGGPLLAVKGYGAAASGVAKFTGSLKKLGGQYGKFFTGLDKMGTKLGLTRENFSKLGNAMKTGATRAAAWVKQTALSTAAMVKNAAATVAMKAKQIALTVAQKAAAVAQWALNAAMSANPITLVVLAIAALVAGLVVAYKNVGWFRDIVDAAWQKIRSATMTVFNAVKTIIMTVFSVIKTVITTYVNVYKTVITTVFNAIKTVVTTYVTAYLTVIRTVFNAIKTVISTALNAAKAVASTVFNAIKTVISTAVDGVKSTVQTGFALVKKYIIDPITSAKDWVSAKVGEIAGFFSGLPGKIGGALGGLWDAITSPFRSAMDWILDKVEAAIRTLQSAVDRVNSLRGIGRTSGIDKDSILPKMHSGGVVTGAPGSEQLRILQAGEWVLSRRQVASLQASKMSASSLSVPAALAGSGPAVQFGDVHLHNAVDIELLDRKMAFAASFGGL